MNLVSLAGRTQVEKSKEIIKWWTSPCFVATCLRKVWQTWRAFSLSWFQLAWQILLQRKLKCDTYETKTLKITNKYFGLWRYFMIIFNTFRTRYTYLLHFQVLMKQKFHGKIFFITVQSFSLIETIMLTMVSELFKDNCFLGQAS